MKKRGFTLIELLAVIVILAVIALIATPIIMGVIHNSKKGAFQDSAYGIVKAAELYYSNHVSATQSMGRKKFTFPDDTELSFQGERPTSGSVLVDEQGQISLAIGNGTWCAKKKETEDKITVKDYQEEDCVLVKPTAASCFTFLDGTITDYTCNDLKEVVIPNFINGVSVTKIGKNSFSEKGLTKVILPDGLTVIDFSAFYKNQLTTIEFPESLTLIGQSSFFGNKLQRIDIPSSVTKIEAAAFGSNQLTEVILHQGLLEIGSSVFSNNQLTTVTIPPGVKKIESMAFMKRGTSNPNLTTIINQTRRGFDWRKIIYDDSMSGTISSVSGVYNGVTVTEG